MRFTKTTGAGPTIEPVLNPIDWILWHWSGRACPPGWATAIDGGNIKRQGGGI